MNTGCSIAGCGGRRPRLGASRAAKLHTRWLSQALPGLFLLLLMGASRPAAAECVGGAFGYLVTVQGVVEISTGGGGWQPVKLNAVVCTGDIIRVGQSSRAGIYFDDIETVTYVDQNTTAVAERPGEEEGSLIIRILEGAINFLSREPRSLEIRTPFVNAGVKGTEFEVRVRLERPAGRRLAGSTVINLIEGRVEARGVGDTKILASGQSGIAAGTCPAGLSIEDLRQGPACEPAAGTPAIRVTARAPTPCSGRSTTRRSRWIRRAGCRRNWPRSTNCWRGAGSTRRCRSCAPNRHTARNRLSSPSSS